MKIFKTKEEAEQHLNEIGTESVPINKSGLKNVPNEIVNYCGVLGTGFVIEFSVVLLTDLVYLRNLGHYQIKVYN